jgi:hypothetical protein
MKPLTLSYMPFRMTIRMHDRSRKIVFGHDRIPRYGPRDASHQLVAQRVQSDRVDYTDEA